jgi:hypothetical protein
MHERGDHSHPFPFFKVKISPVQIGSQPKGNGAQYLLHFIRLQIVTSQHATDLVKLSPHTTPDAQNTFKTKKGKSSTRGINATAGQHPNLQLGYSGAQHLWTDEVNNRMKVVAFPDAFGAPGEKVRQWDYPIADKAYRESGLTFLDPPGPQVKLGFQLSKRPHLEFEMLVYWSMLNESAKRPHSFSRLYPFKNGNSALASAPVFINLIQQVSVSIPLENLNGNCKVFGPEIRLETSTQALNVKLPSKKDKKSAENRNNLVVAFGSALRGPMKSGKGTHSPGSVGETLADFINTSLPPRLVSPQGDNLSAVGNPTQSTLSTNGTSQLPLVNSDLQSSISQTMEERQDPTHNVVMADHEALAGDGESIPNRHGQNLSATSTNTPRFNNTSCVAPTQAEQIKRE